MELVGRTHRLVPSPRLVALTTRRAGTATSTTACTATSASTSATTTIGPLKRGGNGSHDRVWSHSLGARIHPLLNDRIGQVKLEGTPTIRVQEISTVETAVRRSVGKRPVTVGKIRIEVVAGITKRRSREVLQVRRWLCRTSRMRRSSTNRGRGMLQRTRLQRREAKSQERSSAGRSRCQCSQRHARCLSQRVCARQVTFRSKRGRIQKHLLLLLLDGLLNSSSLLPQLVGAHLVFLYGLADARKLLVEIGLQLRLVLLPSELFRSTTLSLIQALGVGRDNPLVLLVNPGTAALKTFLSLDGRVQLRLQRRHFASNSGPSRNELLLSQVELFQFLFVLGFLGRPFFEFFLRNVL